MARLVTAVDPNTGDAIGVDLDDLQNNGGDSASIPAGGAVHVATYQIHHAAISTLPTIPVVFLPPVAGELPFALMVTFSSNIVGAYTNLDSPYFVVTPTGLEDATEQADTGSASGVALLTASNKIKGRMIPPIGSQDIATVGGLGLSVLITNGNAGNLGGGHADNTIDIDVWYLKAD